MNKKSIFYAAIMIIAGIVTIGNNAIGQTLSEDGAYPYPTLFAKFTPENVESYYFKALSLNYTLGEWDISERYASSPVVFLYADYDTLLRDQVVVTDGIYSAYVCCNIRIGDRLYTENNGTLRNLYDDNYNTRIYNVSSGAWENQKVGASTNPNIYNKRGALYQDATQVGWAMETINVSTPTLMKVLLTSN